MFFGIENVDEHLSKDEQLIFFRIIQESTQNMLKHANAVNCELNLLVKNNTVIYSLRDDGAGFDTKTKPNGMGLRSIRERASSVRGTVQIQSAPGQGTRLIVQVPAKG